MTRRKTSPQCLMRRTLGRESDGAQWSREERVAEEEPCSGERDEGRSAWRGGLEENEENRY